MVNIEVPDSYFSQTAQDYLIPVEIMEKLYNAARSGANKIRINIPNRYCAWESYITWDGGIYGYYINNAGVVTRYGYVWSVAISGNIIPFSSYPRYLKITPLN